MPSKVIDFFPTDYIQEECLVRSTHRLRPGEQLREPAQRTADRIEELMNAVATEEGCAVSLAAIIPTVHSRAGYATRFPRL